MLEFFQNVAILLGLNALVLCTANTLIWRYFADEMRDLFDWMIMMFVFWCTEILLVMGVVGFAGHLHILWVSGGVLLCYLMAGVRYPWFRKDSPLIGTWRAWGELRSMIQRQEVLKGQEWIFAVFGFLILFGVIELFNAFVQHPWEYDTLAYHMPMVVEWIQSGTLWDIFYAVWGGPLGYYPAHHELLVAWFVLPMGTDLFANLLNFGVVGVMIVTMYKILKEVGVDDFLAWLSGALVMVMPIFLRQVGTGQVDLLLGLSILIGWFYLLRAFKRHDGTLLQPLFCNFALLLGTKYLSLLYILPLAVVFLFFFKTWHRQTKWWWLWGVFWVLGLGGMWYWRNWVVAGNPFFPAELHIGDWQVFEGYAGLSSRIKELSLWFRVTQSGEWSDWINAMVLEAGWHLYFVIGAYVILVLELLYKLIFGGLKRGVGRIYTLMLFFLPAYWYLYFIAPYTASMMEHNVRYAMPWLILAMIMVIYTVYKMGFARKIAVISLLALLWWQFLLVVFAQRIGDQAFFEPLFLYSSPWLFVEMLVAVGLWIVFFEVWRKKKWWWLATLLVSLVSSMSFFYHASIVRAELRQVSWQHKYGFDLMKGFQWIDENAAPDAVIANSLNPLYYPLYGPDLSRRVSYVNINACESCDYAGFHEKGMTIRDEPDYSAWLNNLKTSGIDYLILGYSIQLGLEGVVPYEEQWVQEHPEDFETVFQYPDDVETLQQGGVKVLKLKVR